MLVRATYSPRSTVLRHRSNSQLMLTAELRRLCVVRHCDQALVIRAILSLLLTMMHESLNFILSIPLTHKISVSRSSNYTADNLTRTCYRTRGSSIFFPVIAAS